MTTKFIDFNFEVTKKSAGGISIEGLSNANTIDRIKEKIDPKGWKLDNYKKNPIVLFDHGHDPAFGSTPIGKALVIEPQEKGLYTKIQISNSKTDKISAIRDLVEEGILKTFSVGFNPIEVEKDGSSPDVNIIKSAELLEQSIVPIPMNQDSTFALLSKRFSRDNPKAVTWLERRIVQAGLAKKGAWVAAAIHQRMFDLLELGEIDDTSAMLKHIATEAGIGQGELTNIMAGKVTPVPAAVISAFAKLLRLDQNFLGDLDKGDVALINRVASRREQMSQEGKSVAKKKTEPKKEKMGQVLVTSVTVPKKLADSAEAAAGMVEAAGYAVDKISETEAGFVFAQPGSDMAESAGQIEMDLGDGVIAMVAPAKSAKKEEPPKEELPPEEEAKAADVPPPAEPLEEEEDEGEMKGPNVAELLTAAIAMAKEVPGAEAIVAKLEEAVAAHSSMMKSSDEPSSTKNIEGTDENPYLLAAGQTNVLLGTLIKEVQGMSGKLDGLANLTLKVAEENADVPPVEEAKPVDENAKSIDQLAVYRRDLDVRLKRLGV